MRTLAESAGMGGVGGGAGGGVSEAGGGAGRSGACLGGGQFEGGCIGGLKGLNPADWSSKEVWNEKKKERNNMMKRTIQGIVIAFCVSVLLIPTWLHAQ